MKRSTGSCSAAHSPRNKFLNAHFLLNSFTAGYSLRRALIINGETLCPHCKQFEDTHHLLIRLSPKIKYSRNAKMVPYHKFSYRTDQQVHDKLREKQFALAKGYYQLVNKLQRYKGRNSVQNSLVHRRLSRIFNFSRLIRTSFSLS